MYSGSKKGGYEIFVQALEKSGDFRVLRKLRPIEELIAQKSPEMWLHKVLMKSNRAAGEHKVVFIDTETTGLNVQDADAIEVGAIALTYDLSLGVFTGLAGKVSMLEDPGYPIPPEVSAVHGISDEDVKGKKFDEVQLLKLCEGAHVIVAHNARFDRPFLEKRFPFFKSMPFACSLAQIPWKSEGFGSGMLEFIAMRRGFFYEAHRAETDCHALAGCLVERLPVSGKWPMELLHDAVNNDDFIVYATGAPFESKDLLKAKSFKWAPDRKAWFREVSTRYELDELMNWLRREVYRKSSYEVTDCYVRKGVNRFSSEQPLTKLAVFAL